jgi:hypothetical protein
MIAFFIILLLTGFSYFFYEKLLNRKKFWILADFFSFTVLWMLYWFIQFFLGVFTFFLVAWGGADVTGFTLFNYLVLVDPFGDSFSGFFGGFNMLFPLVMVLILGTIDLRKKIEKNIIRKRAIQLVEWIWCCLWSFGISIPIAISLFLPWSSSNNFFSFIEFNFNNNTAIFFVSSIISMGLMVMAIFLMLFSIIKIKPHIRLFRNINNGTGIDWKSKFNRLQLRWFICWMGLWIFLIISDFSGLILIKATVITPTLGLTLYLEASNFLVRMNGLIGMFLVCYYGKYPSLVDVQSYMPSPLKEFGAFKGLVTICRPT